mgnify:CR=1 FL=1
MTTHIKETKFNNKETNKQQEEKKFVGSIPETAEIEFETDPLDTMAHVERSNTKDLSIKIKEKFRKVFHDLKGVYIQYQNDKNFATSLIFEYNSAKVPDGKIKNLVPVSLKGANSNSGENLFEINNRLQKKFTGKTFELTDETKLLLAPYMYGDKNQNNYKNTKAWNQRIQEVKESTMNTSPWLYSNNSERVYLVVTGLDIRKLLRAVYGRKMVIKTIINDNKADNIMAEAFYDIEFRGNRPEFSIVNIWQIDKSKVQEVAQRESPKMAYDVTGIKYF